VATARGPRRGSWQQQQCGSSNMVAARHVRVSKPGSCTACSATTTMHIIHHAAADEDGASKQVTSNARYFACVPRQLCGLGRRLWGCDLTRCCSNAAARSWKQPCNVWASSALLLLLARCT
jgi:hypothetical protein